MCIPQILSHIGINLTINSNAIWTVLFKNSIGNVKTINSYNVKNMTVHNVMDYD